MEKTLKSNKPNNSKQVTPQATKVSEAPAKILPESTAILTIEERGAIHIKANHSNAYQKDPKTGKTKKNMILASPYLSDFKVVKNGYMYNNKFHKTLPTNLYTCSDRYIPYTTHPCVRKININADAVSYMTSEESILPPHNKFSWKKLTKINRLRAHLALLADGKPFSIDIIN